ncbi:MAG: histidine phosphatase family protein [Eggerthellaceae bacterium]|jgi:phosphohistidine phosphatase|nr:histidine phosphatase family protein [Eggerthellaceae bacterium]MDR2716189.1 histidine phosphatase family protein [Coriobacteriaceae bacterium]
MEKTIIVIRHAKSDWSTGLPDFERPLLERGRKDACAMGPLLEPYGIDLVWCSAAKRTQETWDCACLGGAHAQEVDSRPSFYGAWADSLVSEMLALDESLSVLAIVSHQPTVGDLVETLARPSPLTAQAADHFPTAGVAVLTYRGLWEGLHPGSAALLSFTRVRGGKR